jgi:hypothetical protein
MDEENICYGKGLRITFGFSSSNLALCLATTNEVNALFLFCQFNIPIDIIPEPVAVFFLPTNAGHPTHLIKALNELDNPLSTAG